MSETRLRCTIFSLLLIAAAPVALWGCGSEHKSDEDFLSELPIAPRKGEEIVGTMPPVGHSIEDAARIRLETYDYDMGLVPHDDFTRGKVKVFNDGKMPLKITRIDTTCACTQGQVTDESAVVPPGGESVIDILIDPRRISGFHSRRVLTITSTDVSSPTVELGVTVQVDPEFDVGPDTIALGKIVRGSATVKRLHFRQLIERHVNILGVTLVLPEGREEGDPDFSCELVPIPEEEWQEPGRHELHMVFTFSPDLPLGPLTRYAYLVTDTRGGRNQLRLTFTGEVVESDGEPQPVEGTSATE